MTQLQAHSLLQVNIAAAIEQTRRLEELAQPLSNAADMVSLCLTTGHKLLICGNGGSASDAADLATEFVCRYQDDRRPYPAICLSGCSATVTAISNDYGFDQVFSRQVEAHGHSGDVLIILTTSGQSPNVKAALQSAHQKGLGSIAFLGRDGGETKNIATIDLLVPGTQTARIQESHRLLYHTLCEMVEAHLAKPV